MEVQLWHTYRTDPRFARTVRVPDTFVETNGMPEVLACFDGLYQRIVEKDYGTPAYEQLPDGITEFSPERLIYEV